MDDFITALLVSITPSALWGALTPMVPLIGVMVVFALGYRFVKRGISGISKGKAKV